MKTFVLSLAVLFGTTAIAADNEGGHHCKDKRDARLAARKTLDSCIKGWWNTNPKMADPTDDCTSTLNTFIESAKALKACRTEKGK